jgi:5-methyltetrahydrofolate--homocysteine methyltransferase
VIVIGEKVNATRRSIREALQTRDEAFLASVIGEQAEAGADYIDLNVGTGSGSREQEFEDMTWLIDIALGVTEKSLCLDSADGAVLRHGGGHIAGRRPWMLNSVKGEEESLAEILPIVAEFDVPFIALAMNEDGIPRDADTRLEICRRIHEEAQTRGIGPERIFFDPLAMPLVTDVTQAGVTYECLRRIKKEFPGAKTTLGLSNISHGLPGRTLLNGTFLAGAVVSGLDSAILDPTRKEIMAVFYAAEAVAGRDRHCRRYARAHKKGLLS